MGVPCHADTGTGVSIPLTVTVTGGSSSSGGGGSSGGTWNTTTPIKPFSWQDLFPSMNQIEPLARVDNRSIQTNPVEVTPPVIVAQQTESVKQEDAVISSVPLKEDGEVNLFLIICLGVIGLVGTIIVVMLIRNRKQY